MGARLRFRRLVGVGGIGTGLSFALEGNHDLGRNESRPARLQDVRDYCKLHIIAHYPAVLLGAAAAGAPFHVLPLGKVGDDEPGRRLRSEMAAVGMDLRFVGMVADRPTLQSICFQYPDGSGGNLTTSDSAAAALAPGDVDQVASFLDSETLALAAPEVSLAVRRHFLAAATIRGAFRVAALTSGEIANAAGFLADVDLLALNEDEAAVLAGVPFAPADPGPFLDACAARLTAAQPAMRAVVTAGPRGAFGFEAGRWVHAPTFQVAVASTAGAGDALLGGVLAALAAGVPFLPDEGSPSMVGRRLSSALEIGVLLSAFKVTSPHTIHPEASLASLRAFATRHGITFAPALEPFLRKAQP